MPLNSALQTGSGVYLKPVLQPDAFPIDEQVGRALPEDMRAPEQSVVAARIVAVIAQLDPGPVVQMSQQRRPYPVGPPLGQAHVASQVKVDPQLFAQYQWSGSTIEYHRSQVRQFHGTGRSWSPTRTS